MTNPVVNAGAMPETSAVMILVMLVTPAAAKRRAKVRPIAMVSSGSSWWLMKPSTLRMPRPRLRPSARMRSINVCMQLPFRIQDNHLLCALCVLCGWRLRSEPQRAQGTQRTIKGTAFFVLSAFFVVGACGLNHKERKEHKELSRERLSLCSLRSLWLSLSV
jgi:hypothetical protein